MVYLYLNHQFFYYSCLDFSIHNLWMDMAARISDFVQLILPTKLSIFFCFFMLVVMIIVFHDLLIFVLTKIYIFYKLLFI